MKNLFKMKYVILSVLIIGLLGFVSISYSQTQQDVSYVVTWTLRETVPEPCPDSGRNQYGQMSQSVCAVYHYRVVLTEMSKEFNTEKEADKFIEDMPIARVFGFGFGSRCENPKKQRVVR